MSDQDKEKDRARAAGIRGERFLRKEERKQCWGAKDAFWRCMRDNGEDASKCQKARKGFESLCPPTWVTHFDRKFQFEKFKEKLSEQGYEALDENFAKKEKEEQNKQ